MLETIVSSLYSAIADILTVFVVVAFSSLELSMAKFMELFPILETTYSVFQAIGIALIILIALFQLAKFFAGPMSSAKSTPLQILLRAAIAAALVYFGGYAVDLVLQMAQSPYKAMQAMSGTAALSSATLGETFTSIGANLVTEAAASAFLGSIGTMGILTNLLLQLILLLVIGWNLLKLIIEVFERYFLLMVTAYVEPLSAPFVSSVETSGIFQRWIGMLFGQGAIMFLSVWTFLVAISAMSNALTATAVPKIVYIFLILAVCKVGQRLDTYMQQLGIGVGTTGGSLLDEALGVGHTLAGLAKGAGEVMGGIATAANRTKQTLGTTNGSTPFNALPLFNRGGGRTSPLGTPEPGGGPAGVGGDFSEDPNTGRYMKNAKTPEEEAARNRGVGNINAAMNKSAAPVEFSVNGEHLNIPESAEKLVRENSRNRALELDNRASKKDASAAGGALLVGAMSDGINGTKYVGNTVRNSKDGRTLARSMFSTTSPDMVGEGDSIQRKNFDKAASDAFTAGYGTSMERSIKDGLQELKEIPEDKMTDAQKAQKANLDNLDQTLSFMDSSLNNEKGFNPEKGLGYLSDVASMTDADTDGRVTTAAIRDKDGKVQGAFTALDAKAYNALGDEAKAGFTAVRNSDGSMTYMRASGVSASADPVTGEGMRYYGRVTPLSGPSAAGATAGAAGGTAAGAVGAAGGTAAAGTAASRTAVAAGGPAKKAESPFIGGAPYFSPGAVLKDQSPHDEILASRARERAAPHAERCLTNWSIVTPEQNAAYLQFMAGGENTPCEQMDSAIVTDMDTKDSHIVGVDTLSKAQTVQSLAGLAIANDGAAAVAGMSVIGNLQKGDEAIATLAAFRPGSDITGADYDSGSATAAATMFSAELMGKAFGEGRDQRFEQAAGSIRPPETPQDGPSYSMDDIRQDVGELSRAMQGTADLSYDGNSGLVVDAPQGSSYFSQCEIQDGVASGHLVTASGRAYDVQAVSVQPNSRDSFPDVPPGAYSFEVCAGDGGSGNAIRFAMTPVGPLETPEAVEETPVAEPSVTPVESMGSRAAKKYRRRHGSSKRR